MADVTLKLLFLLDRAGRYRRLAATLIPVSISIFCLGVVAVDRGFLGYGVSQVSLAACCAWLATDLLANGSLLVEGRPVTSLLALGLAGVGVYALHPPQALLGLGGQNWALPGLTAMAISLVILALAERRRDQLFAFGGRLMLVLGASAAGGVYLLVATIADGREFLIRGGLAAVGVLLVALSVVEAKMLLLGLRLLTSRTT